MESTNDKLWKYSSPLRSASATSHRIYEYITAYIPPQVNLHLFYSHLGPSIILDTRRLYLRLTVTHVSGRLLRLPHCCFGKRDNLRALNDRLSMPVSPANCNLRFW